MVSMVTGLGPFNWDISLFKSLPLISHEVQKVQIRIEPFDMFNHTEFRDLDAAITDGKFGAVKATYEREYLSSTQSFFFENG